MVILLRGGDTGVVGVELDFGRLVDMRRVSGQHFEQLFVKSTVFA